MVKPKLTVAKVEEAIGSIEYFEHNCHGASLALVQSGLLPEGSRVARGFVQGVRGQHSWALVAPEMIYEPETYVVDITLWSYVPEAPRLYIAKAKHWPHRPHGFGRLEYLGPDPTDPIISLGVPISEGAKMFLQMYAPAGLDRRAWMTLLNGPMQGWPSKEIVDAASKTRELAAMVPLDILGMLTDVNPSGLYF
jgi:hypothetical protein